MRSIIRQSVVLPAPAEALYATYLDPAGHGEIAGGPVTIEAKPGAAFKAFDGAISGVVLALGRRRSCSSSRWRSTHFEPSGSGIHADPDVHAAGRGGAHRPRAPRRSRTGLSGRHRWLGEILLDAMASASRPTLMRRRSGCKSQNIEASFCSRSSPFIFILATFVAHATKAPQPRLPRNPFGAFFDV